MVKFTFMLFIAGRSPRSLNAIENVKNICESMSVDYNLITIDLFQNPSIAEETRILATPYLLRTEPGPARKFIGDLTCLEHEILVSS